MSSCEKHPKEDLKPCDYCGGLVCGECECYVSPFTGDPISKEVFEFYLSPQFLCRNDWDTTPRVAHIKCLKVNKLLP